MNPPTNEQRSKYKKRTTHDNDELGNVGFNNTRLDPDVTYQPTQQYQVSDDGQRQTDRIRRRHALWRRTVQGRISGTIDHWIMPFRRIFCSSKMACLWLQPWRRCTPAT